MSRVDLTDLLDAHDAGMTVVVRPWRGVSASGGPVYGPAVEVSPVWVDERRRMLRDTAGRTVTVTATVWAALDTHCPVGSQVRLPSGRETVALVVARREGGGFDVPEHVEIGCE